MNRFVQAMVIVALVALTAGMVMFCYRGCEIVIVHVYTTEENAFSHKDQFDFLEADRTSEIYSQEHVSRTECNYCSENHLCLRLLSTLD